MREPRFGFVGWNPFQLMHAHELARALPGSVIVVEKRADLIEQFSEEALLGSGVPLLVWDKERMADLDGVFDVMVSQTPFTHIERFERSKIAMLQYGLAKEPHNHGAWRALADLCLVYGPYTARKMEYFCRVAQVGNPRFDGWGSGELAARASARYGSLIAPGVKTVLYVPTWGDLSTQELFLDEVVRLSDHYNVLIKLHHNTDLVEPHRKGLLEGRRVHYMGANDDLLDLLHVADVVLSDYSGAIFDALYCQKPVILLQQLSDQRFGEKLDAHSLEYAAQRRIGEVVSDPRALRDTVARVLSGELSYEAENRKLVSELFVPSPGATERAVEALLQLSRGQIPPLDQMQSYVRDEVRRSRLKKDDPDWVEAARAAIPGTTAITNSLGELERSLLDEWLRCGHYARVLRYVELRSRAAPRLYLYRAGIRAATILGEGDRRERLAEATRLHFPESALGQVPSPNLPKREGTDNAQRPGHVSPPARRNDALHKAGRLAEKALTLYPGGVFGNIDFARGLARLSGPRTARRVLESLPGSSPVERDLLLAELARDAGDGAGALRVLMLAQRYHPGERRLLRRIAELLSADGRTEQSLIYRELSERAVPESGARGPRQREFE